MTFVFWLALVAAAPSPRAPMSLTMEQAVDLAVGTHPQVQADEAALSASRATRRAHVGRMLPTLAISDMQNWSHTNFDGLARKLQPLLAGQATTSGFNAGTMPHNYMSNLLSISAQQPLLGLLAQSETFRASRATERAAAMSLKATRRDMALNVRNRYLALFQARALADTARASERALLEQVDDAEHKLAAGALASTDVLRPRAAAAAAKQQAIAAEANEEVARRALLELLGLGATDEQVSFAEPTTTSELLVPQQLHALRAQAMAHRSEIAASQARAQAAQHNARSARLNMLPSVDASMAWMHVYGQTTPNRSGSDKGSANVYYVGLQASWPFWQWGTQFFEQKAAYERARQAKSLQEATERQVGTDVAERHANLLACIGAVEAALAEATSAEEAYRVMSATLSVEAATTTDLLQTEAAQTQARMNLVRARYDLAYAKVALDHALGKDT